MSKPFIALLAAVAAIAMIAAGCGGSDDNTDSTSTSSLTKDEFLKQGNAICAKGNKELGSEFEEFAKEHNLSANKPPSEKQLAEFADESFVPAVGGQLEELRDLGAPSGEEKEVDKILSAAERALEEAEDDPTVITSESNSPFVEVNKMARDYGLTVCGEE